MAAEPLLSVADLSIGFPSRDGGWRRVVHQVGFVVHRAERVAIVGESGSGKSLTALACLGLVPEGGRILDGRVVAGTTDVLGSPPCRIRGGEIGLVFQEAASVLNPVFSVGFQLGEAIAVHTSLGRRECRRVALQWLEEVAIDDPERVAGLYPHELSGGMAQRVMIALALVGEPRLLIADEPTSSLDLITQLRLLELLQKMVSERDLALLMISHDIDLVRAMADRALVMSGGEVVESGPLSRVLSSPSHPATRRIVAPAAPTVEDQHHD